MSEPKHVSETISELTNDPLYEKSFFKDFGCSSLRRDVDDTKIYSGTLGLKFIIENLYKTFVTKAAGFAKRMPKSAFAYYFAILTNHRLLKIHTENSFDANYETIKLIQNIDNEQYFYPQTLARYLSGFENTRILGGRSLKFYYPPAILRKIRVNTLRWSGRVSEATHHLYLRYPCPAVYYLRLMNEYLGQEPPDEPVDGGEEEEAPEPNDIEQWNLPKRMRLAIGRPNINLQGWKPLVKLSPVQRAFFDAADFDPRENPKGLEWSYNLALMNAVSMKFIHKSRQRPRK